MRKLVSSWKPKRRERKKGPEDVEIDSEFYSMSTFYRVRELTTRGKLVDRFYEWNNTRNGMKAWIGCYLNPDQFTPPGTNIYVLKHYQDYHTIIDMNIRSNMGVHRARLFYTQRNGVILWLASAQIGPCYFFSQIDILTGYLQILYKYEFYQTPAEAKRVTEM